MPEAIHVGGGYRLVEHARLDARNTFGVAARAPMLVEVSDVAALPELFGYAMLRDAPVLVLGGGSNLLFADDPPGAVLSLGAQSIAILEDDGDTAIVRADAGVEWHALVLRKLRMRLPEHIPLVGVGGILSGADAAAKSSAGASLVQVYTGLIYRGPALIGECVDAMRRRKEAPSRGNVPPHD